MRRRFRVSLDRRRQPRADVVAAPPPAEVIARKIERDLDEPRPQWLFDAPGWALHRSDERVLHHIVGISGAAGHAIAEAPEESAMFLEERADRERMSHQDTIFSAEPAPSRARASASLAVVRATASAALAAAASDNWPCGPAQSPAIQTLLNIGNRVAGRPPVPPCAAVTSACVTVRAGRYCWESTSARQPGCIMSIRVSSSRSTPASAFSPGFRYFVT